MSLSGIYEPSNLDNIPDSINEGFLIIRHLDRVDDFPGEMQLVSRRKQSDTDIIARMLLDHFKSEPLVLKAIPVFNVNFVSYEMLGPVFDNDFGVMYSFKLQDCLNLEFNLINWEKG
jgi:hypothetical protein